MPAITCERFQSSCQHGIDVSARPNGPSQSRQPRVFHLCFLQNPNVWVGILPQREEIVVSAFRLHGVARERERPRQLQPRQRVYGIDEHDASMVDNPLKLGGGLYRLLRRQVRLATNVDGYKAPKRPMKPTPLVWRS